MHRYATPWSSHRTVARMYSTESSISLRKSSSTHLFSSPSEEQQTFCAGNRRHAETISRPSSMDTTIEVEAGDTQRSSICRSSPRRLQLAGVSLAGRGLSQPPPDRRARGKRPHEGRTPSSGLDFISSRYPRCRFVEQVVYLAAASFPSAASFSPGSLTPLLSPSCSH